MWPGDVLVEANVHNTRHAGQEPPTTFHFTRNFNTEAPKTLVPYMRAVRVSEKHTLTVFRHFRLPKPSHLEPKSDAFVFWNANAVSIEAHIETPPLMSRRRVSVNIQRLEVCQ